MTVTAVRKDPGTDHEHRCSSSTPCPSACGSSGPTRACPSAGGPADLPGHLHQARPGAGRPRRVPHDRSRGRPAARLRDIAEVDPPRSPCSGTASPTTTPRRTPISRPRPPGSPRSSSPGADRRGCRSRASSQPRGDGAGPRHGRRGGPQAGRRPDRRHPGRGRREERIVTSRTTQTTTHTLDVPGATLTYDVRRNDASTEPILLLIASPMGAAGFGTLSQHFSDRTVVSYDPRGVERSVTTDPTSPVTLDVHADDVHRLVQAIGGGRSTCSPAAVARSTRSPSCPGTRRTCGCSSRMSRRWPRSCPTASTRWRPPARSMRPTSAAAGAPGWRTSSPSAAIRDRSPPRSPASRRPTRRCSACRPRTTARARTRCSDNT